MAPLSSDPISSAPLSAPSQAAPAQTFNPAWASQANVLILPGNPP